MMMVRKIDHDYYARSLAKLLILYLLRPNPVDRNCHYKYMAEICKKKQRNQMFIFIKLITKLYLIIDKVSIIINYMILFAKCDKTPNL